LLGNFAIDCDCDWDWDDLDGMWRETAQHRSAHADRVDGAEADVLHQFDPGVAHLSPSQV
jgi:hypothetical protein